MRVVVMYEREREIIFEEEGYFLAAMCVCVNLSPAKNTEKKMFARSFIYSSLMLRPQFIKCRERKKKKKRLN